MFKNELVIHFLERMQTKKKHVKSRIDAVAVDLFATKGFLRTGMSEIAKKAGVSVGNIYLYYDNKEELFYSLVPHELVEKGKMLLIEKVGSAHGSSVQRARTRPEVKKKQEEFLQFLIQYRLPLLAAFRHGKGTLYESLFQDVLTLTLKLVLTYAQTVQKDRRKTLPPEKEDILRLIYTNLLFGTLHLLQAHASSMELRQRLEALLEYHFGGLEKVFS